ncbi:MAG: VWA domain-containing protein [Candidatus Magasanikbacteria bacterium]|nr:VWA domain-containing protein [Candidatus Magasanikbacteria bacterium]
MDTTKKPDWLIKAIQPVSGLPRQEAVSTPLSITQRIQALSSKGVASGKHAALQVVFFCDTTGSMYSYFDRVRCSINQIVERITQEGISAEFAVYGYKNHGKEEWIMNGLPFQHQAFTTDAATILNMRMWKGGGGDGLCAVEDAFHHLNQTISSHPIFFGAKRVAIVIGDMPPHGVIDSVTNCPYQYDYRQEVRELHRHGFTFYSVFCCSEDVANLGYEEIPNYFRWLAKETNGRYLDISDINSLIDLLLGICMKEIRRLDSFIADLEKRRTLSPNTKRLLLALKAGS